MAHLGGSAKSGRTKMTSRDTHDIENNVAESGHNVQIRDVLAMMAHTEPELFGQSSAVLMTVKKNEPSDSVKIIAERMMECVRWHANLQKEYWKELFDDGATK